MRNSPSRLRAMLLAFLASSVLLTASLPISTASAATGRINDDFAVDSSLNTSVWKVNGPVGSLVAPNVCGGCSFVQPQLSFSNGQGMGITGVNNIYQVATIESADFVNAPITATADVMAATAHGNAFFFAISTVDAHFGVAVLGNVNSDNGPYYGINVDTGPGVAAGGWISQNKLYASPSTDVLYHISITIDIVGLTQVVVSSGGTALGSMMLQQPVGCTAPCGYYVVFGQAEGLPYVAGANQASWTSIDVSNQVSVATASTSSGGGGGAIPVFPFQLLAVVLFTATLVVSYLSLRHRRGGIR